MSIAVKIVKGVLQFIRKPAVKKEEPVIKMANAWQGYADNLVASGKLSGAAILSHDGAVWASKNLGTATAEEFVKLAKSFRDPSEIRASGIWLSKTKYMALGCDGESVKGKKVGSVLAAN
jgi:hypothetical protein